MTETIVMHPGEVGLADWRAIYRGAAAVLYPDAARPIRASAAAVERILARGEPVYGINTGFGKLASVRIEAGDLATLQRNIVLSHAAGIGDPSPTPVIRLMMALKLASLAQGASGRAASDGRPAGGADRPQPDADNFRARDRSARPATWRLWRIWPPP